MVYSWFSTAPASSFVGGIDFATPPHVISKGEEYSPTVYGYNAYGLLINTEMSNYTITCDERIGYVKPMVRLLLPTV